MLNPKTTSLVDLSAPQLEHHPSNKHVIQHDSFNKWVVYKLPQQTKTQ